MVNYQRGKIYKLVSEHTEKIYIGSTTQKYLSDRLSGHACKFRKYTKDHITKNTTKSVELFKLGEVQIILIENFPCNDVNELKAREAYYIKLFKRKVVNETIPLRTNREYREDNREDILIKKKQYREKHKEDIKIKKKEYREKHKEDLRIKSKEYYENHKQNQKEYRNINKAKIAARMKEYYKQHREDLLNKQKERKQRNKDLPQDANKNIVEKVNRKKSKDAISIQKKEYYKTHKEHLLKKQKERYQLSKLLNKDKERNNI